MTFLVAAAGTGGHVFPGLAVGEALVDQGMPRDDILFVGGARLESAIYPEEGFPFLGVELRGLQRSPTLKNLTLPGVVFRARNRIHQAMVDRQVRAVLGMGGYVTIPTAMAAKRASVPFLLSEQNADAGLANRVASRWASKSFGSFPETGGLPRAEWVGNPVRGPFWSFQRQSVRSEALHRYGLSPGNPVLGVFGGSLGAGIINEAVATMVLNWEGAPMQVVHLTGERHLGKLQGLKAAEGVVWKRVPFEDAMEMFYAVCDLVVARAGGAVAELTATGSPSILVPGAFGSAGHQKGNARFLTDSGAALTVQENELARLSNVVKRTLFSPHVLDGMRSAAHRIARPGAAKAIARAMIEVVS